MIATWSFNYIKKPHILANFVWRYTYLNCHQCRHNNSISPVTVEDIQQIQHIEGHLQDDNHAHCEFHILMVLDHDNPTVEKQFIISFPPKYTACSPLRQATRPMLAFNVEVGEIVFLKHNWRADVDGMEKEGKIYGILEAKGIPNIVPFGRGNDLCDHVTLIHTLTLHATSCCDLTCPVTWQFVGK